MSKKIAVVFSCVVLMLFAAIAAFTWERQAIDEPLFGASRYGTETYWQDIIHQELCQKETWESIGKEVRLDDGTRVDLIFTKHACEIDWANKWAEGVGQAVYYGLKTQRFPLVILLVKKGGWEKYRDRVQYCGVECWVYDTRTQEWLDKE